MLERIGCCIKQTFFQSRFVLICLHEWNVAIEEEIDLHFTQFIIAFLYAMILQRWLAVLYEYTILNRTCFCSINGRRIDVTDLNIYFFILELANLVV